MGDGGCYCSAAFGFGGLLEGEDGAVCAGDFELAFYLYGRFCKGCEDGFGEVAYGCAGGGEECVEG